MNRPEQTEKEVCTGERRSMSRLEFSASAEVVDLMNAQRLTVRITDVGIGGCFVDTMFPFTPGCRVRVTLRNAMNQFEAEGRVAYAQERIGMGITFDKLNSDQRLALIALL